jgi:hypothetical protein
MLLAHMDARLDPIREKRRALEASRQKVYDIILEGIDRARKEAVVTMEIVREAVKLNHDLGKMACGR